jgi:hypothetical protein
MNTETQRHGVKNRFQFSVSPCLSVLLLLLPAFVMAQEYAGLINNVPIHMKLTFQQNAIAGSYVFDKVDDKELPLKGTKQGDHVQLSETDAKGKMTGNFDGVLWENLLIQGTWTTPDGKRHYPFRVLEVRPNDQISGQYEMAPVSEHYQGTLNLLLTKDGKVRIQGQAFWIGDVANGSAHDAEVDGSADLKDNQILYGASGGEDDCKFTIVLAKDALEVKDDTMNCGGMNVTFEGKYDRTGPPSFEQNLD